MVKALQALEVAILEISKNGCFYNENRKTPPTPSFGSAVLSAEVLCALSPAAPPLPWPHSRPQFNHCIVILIKTHLCLSSQSLSVKLHFFGRGPGVVLSELLISKYEVLFKKCSFLRFEAEVGWRYVLKRHSLFSLKSWGCWRAGETVLAWAWVGLPGAIVKCSCSATTSRMTVPPECAGKAVERLSHMLLRKDESAHKTRRIWGQTIPHL